MLNETIAAWRALPDEVRRRVHLVSGPTTDPEQNAVIINALQRHAAVVVQKSLREGFGLTVTEGMWKGRPVLAERRRRHPRADCRRRERRPRAERHRPRGVRREAQRADRGPARSPSASAATRRSGCASTSSSCATSTSTRSYFSASTPERSKLSPAGRSPRADRAAAADGRRATRRSAGAPRSGT